MLPMLLPLLDPLVKPLFGLLSIWVEKRHDKARKEMLLSAPFNHFVIAMQSAGLNPADIAAAAKSQEKELENPLPRP